MTALPYRALLLLPLLGLLSGCAGYRVGNISGRDLQGVHSVYVPVVRNESLEPDLQMVATNAIIRRFENDGTLSVNQDANSDSELDVTITDVLRQPIRSSTTDVLLTAEYQLTDRGQGHLRQPPPWPEDLRERIGHRQHDLLRPGRPERRRAPGAAARGASTSPTTPFRWSPRGGSPRFRPDAHSGRVARPPGNQPTFPSRRSAYRSKRLERMKNVGAHKPTKMPRRSACPSFAVARLTPQTRSNLQCSKSPPRKQRSPAFLSKRELVSAESRPPPLTDEVLVHGAT